MACVRGSRLWLASQAKTRRSWPIVGIPVTAGLRFNMRRVEALGLGRSLSREMFAGDPAVLITELSAVAADGSYARRAGEFRELLKAWDAPRLGADIIERVARADRS